VASFIRPQGSDAASTPRLVSSLEALAERGRTRPVTMPAYLYPLRALLWLVGFVAVYKSPARAVGTVRKEISILRKRIRNARKARARARVRESLVHRD
jgi:hypothetical protein